MMKGFFIFIAANIFLCLTLAAQTDSVPRAFYTTKENRATEYRNLVSNSINKNLSLALSDLTEENWEEAFYAMELINYHSANVDKRIRSAFASLEKRSTGFQRAYLEMIYTNYPKDFVPKVAAFAKQTQDPKLFAMCSEYLFMNNKRAAYVAMLKKRMAEISKTIEPAAEIPFFSVLEYKLLPGNGKRPPVNDLTNNTFLPNEIVLFSFQRKNRNYPGLVMVRGKDGVFIKDESGKYFAVPQLARSITNMPGYITNGNTPQGIFKMIGFGVSKGTAIGPTPNIQMVLPYERSADVPDSVTKLLGDDYKYLLPDSWKQYNPFFEAWYAGKAGRTEIIAHGTTVNPQYYKNKPYYPLTPTQGCLTTKEIWSGIDGKRIESNQQKLVNALKAAGGANGYCVVIEIDDQQKPVSLKDIIPYLNQK
ncbi:MAG: hypothetical protein ABIO79_08920 [Ferruginibacter sp.]